MTSLLLIPLFAAASLQTDAKTLYQSSQAKIAEARSLRASIEVKNFDRVDRYEILFLKKNFGKVTSKDAWIMQNGKTLYDYDPAAKEYWSRPAPEKGFAAGTAFSLGGLVGLESLVFPNEPALEAVKSAARKWQGRSVTAITLKGVQDKAMVATLFLDPSTKLPLGWEYELREFKASGKFLALKLDPPAKESDFAWAPPKGAKRIG